jgi:FtsH-binding integral membrane protein
MFTNTYVDNNKKIFDNGLRQYFLSVYNYIALALGITGVAAFASLNFEPLMRLLYNVSPSNQLIGLTGFGWMVNFSPLLLAMFFMGGFRNMEVKQAQTMFLAYATLMGMSLSYLGLIYTGQSIVKTFFICSASFAGMSIYGYSTDKDLTSMGSFMMMGLIGIVIASLINIFLQSSAIYFATSFLGIFIFLGLIAYDTQKLKYFYYQAGGGEEGQKMAVLGALMLYMDLINLFIHTLRFFGDKKD